MFETGNFSLLTSREELLCVSAVPGFGAGSSCVQNSCPLLGKCVHLWMGAASRKVEVIF